MKRAAVFVHGRRLKKDRVLEFLKKFDTILCADGGVKHVLAYGLIPYVVVGDQDSITPLVKKQLANKKVTWITHPPEKNFTDSELTINYAIDQEFDEFIIFGVSGTRLDHVLSNILYLSYHTKTLKITIVEDYQTIIVLKRGRIDLTGKKGQQVSLIPLDKEVYGISTRGLKWELKNATLEFGKTIGVSNEFVGEKVTVSVKKGPLLVIHSLKNL